MMLNRLTLATCLVCACTPTTDDVPQGTDAGEDVARCSSDGASGPLVINEFMAINAVTHTNAEGVSHDWVELHNPSGEDIGLCGWTMTVEGEGEFEFERELAVPAGGHTLIWFVGDREVVQADQVALHVRGDGGTIGLLGPGDEVVDEVTFGAQLADFSAARQSDGAEMWSLAWHPTPGTENVNVGILGKYIATEEGQIPSADGIGELIHGYDEIPQIGIQVDDTGIQSLRENPYQYVQGFIVFDGREYGPVGVRLKGQNSFAPIDDKPSFRINMDEFVNSAKFFGLDDLTLNNMHSDMSMMHERLAYWVAREFGPASRSNHALVTLNGEFYGLYTNVETVKWHMLENWFEDPTGPLYEGTDVDFRPEFISQFEHEAGPDDRTLLEDLAAALQLGSPGAAMAAANQVVDIDSFHKFWAMSAVIGQFDGLPYSNPGDDFFVYADPTSGKLHFIPWGMDETFYSSEFDVFLVNSRLATTCLAVDSCYQDLVDEIWDTLDRVEQMDLAGERTRVAQQISPYVTMDTNKQYSNADVTEFQTQLRYFIEGRRATLSKQLPPRSQP